MIYNDISGEWSVFLDETKGETFPAAFPDKITLPNTTSAAQLGQRSTEKSYGCLTDLYRFEGYAWFTRIITVTREMAEQNLMLVLERTRKTAVFVDGEKIGEYCSLCAPHRYFLSGISEGEHTLTVRVDNTDYPTRGGHLTSPDTQTNWNGITGEIALMSFKTYPEYVKIVPNFADNSVTVISGLLGEKTGMARIRVCDDKTEYGSADADLSDTLECTVKLSDNVPRWSEFSPALLNLEIAIGEDIHTVKFGFRELRADGMKLRINGDETFLRGKHDGLVFPKTGYAPTDVGAWLDVFKTALDYGINHYRFHTCCPPDAAFAAADMLGIYLQPELPFWGTIPDAPDAEFEFLREEGFRILKEFGHHPSFAMMSLGNELWGSHELLNGLLGEYKSAFPDKLYVQGSNNFQFVPCVLENDDFFSGVRLSTHDRLLRGSCATCDAPLGHIQINRPNSDHSYDRVIDPEIMTADGDGNGGEIMIQYGTEMKRVKFEAWELLIPEVPLISHEVGQYVIYPDYREIERYTGSLRHDTYDGYRSTAEKKGLLPYAEDFFRASGTLAVDCYRREIETALRSEKMSGFQLLDIQDFPGQGTATVGILNAFMESKGLVEPAEWRRFCSSTVLLAELEKFVFTGGEEIRCGLLVSNTAPNVDIREIEWKVTADGKALAGGTSAVDKSGGRISRAADIEFRVNCTEPTAAVLELRSGRFSNSYKLYVYPEIDVTITENEIKYGGRTLPIVHDKPQENALCIPYPGEDDLKGEYCTDFWCYGMFRSISESMGRPVPTGTLGLLIDTKSRLLSGFPCDSYTTPIWFDIVTHSFSAKLDGSDIVPEVAVIDNPQRAERLGLLYRNGGVVCTSRLWEIADNIEVKHFAASLVKSILTDSKGEEK